MSVSRGTVHSIQFLRFVAATLVVIFHAHLALLSGPIGHADVHEAYLFGFGACGVHIFFVISGYIMYLTNFGRADRFRAGRFFLRRMIRIYPAYWIFGLLYIVAHIALGSPYHLSSGQFLGTALLWPGDASRVIGPAWTLSYELYFYLAFGLFMLLGAWRGPIALSTVFLASAALGFFVRPQSVPVALATNALLVEFVAGVWIARLTARRDWPRWSGWLATLVALLGFAGGLAIGYDRFPSAVAWGAPSALLVLGFVILERSGGVPGTRRLSVFGDSSYSLYLCHILLIDLAITALEAAGSKLPVMMLTGAVAVACVLFAHLFHLGIERPVVSVLNGRTRTIGSGAPAP